MCLHGKGVDVSVHHVAQRGENQTVPLEPCPALEGLRDDCHPEVPTPVPGARMTGVEVAFVFDFQKFRRKSLAEGSADSVDAHFAHGSTYSNGWGSMPATTPAELWVPAAVQARASLRGCEPGDNQAAARLGSGAFRAGALAKGRTRARRVSLTGLTRPARSVGRSPAEHARTPEPAPANAHVIHAPGPPGLLLSVMRAGRIDRMAVLVEIHPQTAKPRLVREVADLVEAGGIIAYPTDSSYAFGWAMGNKAAQDRIRHLKHLDKHHHFTVVCRDLSDIAHYARVDNQAYRLLRGMTPGPITFILPATRQVPNRLQHPKRKSIGIRVPDNPIALALLEALPEPLMSTTLQLPGQEHPMNEPWEIDARLGHELAAVVDGGPCALDSTSVVDLTGAVPLVARRALGDVTHLETA